MPGPSSVFWRFNLVNLHSSLFNVSPKGLSYIPSVAVTQGFSPDSHIHSLRPLRLCGETK